MKKTGKSRKILSVVACSVCLCLIGLAARAAELVLEFTGDGSYIDLGTPDTLQFASNEAFTVEAWVYLEAFDDPDMLYCKNNGRDGPYTYMFGFYPNGRMTAYDGGSWRQPDPVVTVSVGQWHHVAFAFDGTNLAFYLDGELGGTYDDFNFSNDTEHNVKIGGYKDSADINGMKSDVRVWDHVRTEDQIQAYMQYRLRSDENGLQGYWPMNEGSGTEVLDATVSGTTGTIINAAWTIVEGVEFTSFGDALPSEAETAAAFTLANLETGSADFTGSNTVEVTDFPVPEGYNRFQVTESGDLGALGGWQSTSTIPETVDFSWPGSDSNVILYAWFTNNAAAVTLRRASGDIFYTPVKPAPNVRPALTRERLPGKDVLIYASDIDVNSTGGNAHGMTLGIHSRAANAAEAGNDQTPDEPYVTLDAEGDYPLLLWLQNEAGNTITSASTCTVSVVEYDGTNVWTGDGSTDSWHDMANWTAGVPLAGQDVEFTSGSMLLAEETASLASFTMSGGTLTFSSWTTRLQAAEIDVRGGELTLPPAFTEAQMSNRVWIVASGDFTLGSNAVIDVAGKGYDGENGEGKGAHDARGTGAGYGGQGGMGSDGKQLGGQPYGVVDAPTAPGSGGGTGSSPSPGAGGGAVRIVAEGIVTVNGTILADGDPSSWRRPGGGSGGSIYITCSTFRGSTNGLLSANGGAVGQNGTEGGNGGGGRIAVHYEQLGSPRGVRFSAERGEYGWASQNPDKHWHRNAFPGTLWLPDTDLLSNELTDGRFSGVRLFVGNTNAWSPDNLVVSHSSITFAGSNFQVNVAGDVTIGDGGELGIGDPHGDFGGELTCGGDLALGGGGALCVYSGATNGVTAYGAAVAVIGNISVGVGSWILPHSHARNGGSVRFQCTDLTIATNGGFNAWARGFGDQLSVWGPGQGGSDGGGAGGAGYGGRGADHGTKGPGGQTYGSTNAPLLAGSSGGRGSPKRPGRGGGLVWVEVDGPVDLNGTINADGADGNFRDGGGSGGGIFLVASDVFTAGPQSALLARGGGEGSNSGAGGGGRIAVWQYVSASQRELLLAGANLGQSLTNGIAGVGTVSVTNGVETSVDAFADPGTVVFLTLPPPPPPGTLFLLR